MSFNLSLEQVKSVLANAGQGIVEAKRTVNNLGTMLRLQNGCVVTCWDKGTVNCQGKNAHLIEGILSVDLSADGHNRKVFVVYGHDGNAKTQLEALLRRLDLEPIILDQQISSGQTIIEKLEAYTKQANFGIILATPDDIGYPKEDESKKRYRVRQNVVLELGMLLSKMGRDRVAILLSQAEDMERPSDIDGLIYIPFKNNVEEAKLSLAKEMQNNGYHIDLAKL